MALGVTTRRGSSALASLAIALAASASIATFARPAHGGGQATADDAQRTELYREASRFASAGRWAEAKERLRAVIAIRPSPKVYFSLAQAEEQLGQLASAQADYARSLEGAATEGKGDVVQAAELAQRALLPRVPHVRIVVSAEGVRAGSGSAASGGGVNASATIDDRPVPTGTPVAVDPGDHRLVVSAPAMRSATLSVRLGEGQQLDVPVSLEAERTVAAANVSASTTLQAPLAASARASNGASSANGGGAMRAEDDREAASGASTGGPSTSWRTAGALTAAVGVIALGVGVVFGLDSKSKHDAAVKVCPESACMNANDAKLWHDAVSAGNASTIAFILGGIGVVGGAVLWFAAPSSSSSSGNRSGRGGRGTEARIGVGPGSVQLRGAW